MGNSKSAYIAIVGTPNCGKNELYEMFQQQQLTKSVPKSLDTSFGTWFTYKKWNICAYQTNDNPSNWSSDLQDKYNHQQLDAIWLIVPGVDFEETSQICVSPPRHEYGLIMSHWQREMTDRILPDPILNLLYEYLTETYQTRDVYMDFIHNDLNKFGCLLIVGWWKKVGYTRKELQDMMKLLKLDQLSDQLWYIEGMNSDDNTVCVWRLLEFGLGRLKQKK